MSGKSNNGPPFNVRVPAKPVAKKSVFERQRAEAEARRQRDAAETAAVYEDFVKSFDDGGSAGGSTTASGAPHHHHHHVQQQQPTPPRPKSGATFGATGGRRHFSIPSTSGSHRNSGPGSLGPVPGSRQTHDGRPSRPSHVGSKLGFGSDDDDDNNNGDDHGDRKRHREADSEEEGQIAEDDGHTSKPAGALARAEEKAASKPTIRLASLPPGTSPAAITALVASSSSLAVDAVRILPSTASASGTDRKSVAAIVTLSAETAANDIDAAVSALQNRYLGFGYYLNLHRHLSSAVAASSSAGGGLGGGSGIGPSAQPFGARPVPPAAKSGPGPAHAAAGFSPPASFRGGRNTRGIPPPATFTSPSAGLPSRDGILYVPVRPPRDVKKLRMIHKVIEQVLDRGPEFEALLMSRPEVQLQEKWAWIWDARSEAGVWYRYRLWETVAGLRTQKQAKEARGRYVPLFEGSHAWKIPDHDLPYEFDTSLAEIVSGSDYDSSDNDSDADAPPAGGGGGEAGEDDRETFLNPLEKARLTHLLARLPTTLSKLRRGDIARVTAFAITHASRGASEIVDMIVANVERPLAYTAANPDYRRREAGSADGGDTGPDEASAVLDTSGAQLVAVYVVSDILSSSATSGIRHAWRFRQLFDATLRRHDVFATLGQLADKLHWGRLRADKWQRSIGLVLSLWEGWSVFSAETQAFLVSTFKEPPSTKKKEAEAASVAAEGGTDAAPPGMAASAKKSRWKTVDTAAAPEQRAAGGFRLESAVSSADKMQVDSAANVETKNTDQEDDDDNEWAYRSDYTDDEALDLACMDNEDIDGEPMDPPPPNEPKSRRRRYDGIPLTADEIRLLADDVAEMSEEGEIGSDDDDDDKQDLLDDDAAYYHLSDLSSVTSSSSSSDSDDDDSGDRHDSGRDVAMAAGEPVAGTGTTTTGMPGRPSIVAGKTAPASAPAGQASSVQASSVQAPPVQTAAMPALALLKASPGASTLPLSLSQSLSQSTSSSSAPPRKRMRAADMFADSDEGES